MRCSSSISLVLILTCLVSCRERAPIEDEDDKEDPAPSTENAATSEATPTSSVMPETMASREEPIEAPIAMQSDLSQRVEALSFAHGNGLCLQVSPNGQTSLQACSADAPGQKFLFSRSLDGRVQLKDTSSQRCLAVGPQGFFVTLLRADICESKSSQFFSVVDYGTSYSLKFDANNTCIDAEQGRAEPGTRLVMFRCSAVLNQKILVSKL